MLPVIDELINRGIALDPGAAEQLEQLRGAVIQVQPIGIPGTWFIAVHGGIHLLKDHTGDSDVQISGTPGALLRLLLSDDPARLLFDREVTISGDRDLLQRLQRLLRNLDIDWEEEAARRIGDGPARALSVRLQGLRGWVRQAGDSLRRDLEEYLVEESRAATSRPRVDEFVAGVDELRDGVARLEKRVARVQSRLDAEEEGS